MIDLVERHVRDVANACAKHRVARLDVFGSATRPDFRPGDSDLDLLVDFQPMAPTELFDAPPHHLQHVRQLNNPLPAARNTASSGRGTPRGLRLA